MTDSSFPWETALPTPPDGDDLAVELAEAAPPADSPGTYPVEVDEIPHDPAGHACTVGPGPCGNPPCPLDDAIGPAPDLSPVEAEVVERFEAAPDALAADVDEHSHAYEANADGVLVCPCGAWIADGVAYEVPAEQIVADARPLTDDEARIDEVVEHLEAEGAAATLDTYAGLSLGTSRRSSTTSPTNGTGPP